jgi:sigma-E factor negative regulatory protein RseB
MFESSGMTAVTEVSRRLNRALLLLLAISNPASAQSDTDDPRTWLEAMSQAMQSLNYDGTFVYLHDGKLETMRVIHRADQDGERERLIALTGVPREVLRDDNSVTCILPDQKTVMVDKSLPRKPFPASLPRDLAALQSNYDFRLAGDDRITGRDTRIIEIYPRDEYRYGYRLWIDKAYKVLLKFDLIDPHGKALEQTMFTRLDLPTRISDKALEAGISGEGYTWHGDVRRASSDATPADGTDWKLDWLPRGFMLTHHNRHQMPVRRGSAEHMVYSDGLATVSVYFEKLLPGKEILQGVSNMGTVNAMGGVVDGFHATVVGEVPAVTVEEIGKGISLRR